MRGARSASAWSSAGRARRRRARRVTLYACVLKGEKFAWTLQKATELGAAAITPVVSERTIAAEGNLTEGKGERWSRIVREAAEQCRAARLPALRRPLLVGRRRGGGTAGAGGDRALGGRARGRPRHGAWPRPGKRSR